MYNNLQSLNKNVRLVNLMATTYIYSRVHVGCSVTRDNSLLSAPKSRDAQQLPSWRKFLSAAHNHQKF